MQKFFNTNTNFWIFFHQYKHQHLPRQVEQNNNNNKIHQNNRRAKWITKLGHAPTETYSWVYIEWIILLVHCITHKLLLYFITMFGCTFGGTDGNCTANTERSAFDRWVRTYFLMQNYTKFDQKLFLKSQRSSMEHKKVLEKSTERISIWRRFTRHCSMVHKLVESHRLTSIERGNGCCSGIFHNSFLFACQFFPFNSYHNLVNIFF